MILMIGPSSKSKGGISAVIATYEQTHIFKKYKIHHIVTSVTGKNNYLIFIVAVSKMIFSLLRDNVKIVHIHTASRKSFWRKSVFFLLAKVFNKKTIIHLHGGEFDQFYSKESGKYKQKLIRSILENSDVFIVLSSQWLKWSRLNLSKNDHARIIYNAVPLLNIESKKHVEGIIVFLGYINIRKGIIDLIHALSKVKKQCPHAHLVIAGDGDIELAKSEVSRRGVVDSVEFSGWITGNDKISLMAMADIYCLPSYHEGFPMGVLEAMSAGVPVVASTAGGIPDAITDHKEGLLVEAGDIDGLAKALISMIENRELNRTYSIAANQKFQENFSLEAVMPQLDALYSKLLGYKP